MNTSTVNFKSIQAFIRIHFSKKAGDVVLHKNYFTGNQYDLE
jgi:hypothetical protein